MNNNKKIISLFEQLNLERKKNKEMLICDDNFWKIKIQLVCEILNKYSSLKYNEKLLCALHIPANICSIIIKMEAEILGIDLV